LQAATFKFMTSIAGLGSSILYSIAKKRLLARLERRTEAFCRQLEQRMGLITPVALALASHRELVKFNSELGRSIATHLDQTIGKTMGEVMAPMASLLERMTENMAELNREAIEQMLLMFTERLQGAAAQEMSRLIDALQAVHGAISSLVADIDTGRRAIADELTRASADLGRALSAAGETVETRLSGAAEDFSGAMGRSTAAFGVKVSAAIDSLSGTLDPLAQLLDGLQARLLGLDDAMTRQRASIETLISEMLAAMAGLQASAANVGAAAGPLGPIAAAMNDSIGLLSEASARLGTLDGEFAMLTKLLSSASGSLANAWQGTEIRFGKLDDNLARVFEQLNSGLETFRGGMESFVTDVDRSMAHSVKLLGGAVGELTDTVDGLTVWRKLESERL
jgi:ABC-type transporter Mla subunit MlaD